MDMFFSGSQGSLSRRRFSCHVPPACFAYSVGLTARLFNKEFYHCSLAQALENFRTARIAFAAASLVLAASALTTALLSAGQSIMPLWVAAGAVIAGLATAFCHHMVKQFTFVPYHHWAH